MNLSIPTLFFESGYLLDSSYERAVVNQPTIEAFQRRAQVNWSNVGEVWLRKTLELTGKGFSRRELTANLIMHPNLMSCSHPFLININGHLPEPDPDQFSELVYHELLHLYLDQEFPELWKPQESPLLEKYRDEGDHATMHLHLYAIEKRVLLDCDREDLWEWVVGQAATAHSPGYQRALEIVESEGESVFWMN